MEKEKEFQEKFRKLIEEARTFVGEECHCCDNILEITTLTKNVESIISGEHKRQVPSHLQRVYLLFLLDYCELKRNHQQDISQLETYIEKLIKQVYTDEKRSYSKLFSSDVIERIVSAYNTCGKTEEVDFFNSLKKNQHLFFEIFSETPKEEFIEKKQLFLRVINNSIDNVLSPEKETPEVFANYLTKLRVVINTGGTFVGETYLAQEEKDVAEYIIMNHKKYSSDERTSLLKTLFLLVFERYVFNKQLVIKAIIKL